MKVLLVEEFNGGIIMIQVSDVRFKTPDSSDSRLLAFASAVLAGGLVVHDLRVIRGAGRPFLSFPSRKFMFRCSECTGRNVFSARW